MMQVSLHDILDAREARVRKQQFLLTEFRAPLLCFTMNIAGPVKVTPLIRRGFEVGLEILERRLPEFLYRDIQVLPTGCEAFFSVAMPARKLKALCTDIEENHPLGRLFDMDVLDVQGAKLERECQRSCLVCGKPGRGCAASRAHSVEQLQAVTRQLLEAYFSLADRKQIADFACESLLDEVNTTPKPGLVDRRNNGSHKDMALRHFYDSVSALMPYFEECVKLGQETSNQLPESTFPLLRQAGLSAEQAMYHATGGINTHKGAIYTLGILCGSIGRLWSPEKPIADIPAILSECIKVAQASARQDLSMADGSTAGQRAYLHYGIGGIREEVAAGLPSVALVSLPAYMQGLKDGLSPNDAGAIALLHLIAKVQDTNLYHRGGIDGAQWAAKAAQALLPCPTTQQIEALDDAFIHKNLSPGGCADLLAVTYFLHRLQITEQKA